jgi:hypothetical protein
MNPMARTNHLDIRLSDEELFSLRQAAMRLGKTVSAYVRDLVVDKAPPDEVPQEPEEPECEVKSVQKLAQSFGIKKTHLRYKASEWFCGYIKVAAMDLWSRANDCKGRIWRPMDKHGEYWTTEYSVVAYNM